MLNVWDPDEYTQVLESHTCSFHMERPGEPFAGCTCWVSCGQRRRPDDEIARIKADRNRLIEDAILAEAEQIKARRAQERE